MANIQRGTTPTITFTLPADTPQITAGTVTLSQNGKVVIKKAFSSLTVSGNTVSVVLTQAETLLLDCDYAVEIQLKPKFGDGTVPNTHIHVINADKVLDEEAI